MFCEAAVRGGVGEQGRDLGVLISCEDAPDARHKEVKLGVQLRNLNEALDAGRNAVERQRSQSQLPAGAGLINRLLCRNGVRAALKPFTYAGLGSELLQRDKGRTQAMATDSVRSEDEDDVR